MAGCTLSHYLRLIDATSRMIREGKASLGANVSPIFGRLGVAQEVLEATVAKLFEPRARIANFLGSTAGMTERQGSRSHPALPSPDFPRVRQ